MSGACCLWWRACCRQCTPVQRIPSPPRRSKRTRTHRAQSATPYRELAYQLSDPISVLSGFSDVLLGLLHRLRALASMHSLQQLLHVLLRHLLVHGHLPSPRVLRHLLDFLHLRHTTGSFLHFRHTTGISKFFRQEVVEGRNGGAPDA